MCIVVRMMQDSEQQREKSENRRISVKAAEGGQDIMDSALLETFHVRVAQ